MTTSRIQMGRAACHTLKSLALKPYKETFLQQLDALLESLILTEVVTCEKIVVAETFPFWTLSPQSIDRGEDFLLHAQHHGMFYHQIECATKPIGFALSQRSEERFTVGEMSLSPLAEAVRHALTFAHSKYPEALWQTRLLWIPENHRYLFWFHHVESARMDADDLLPVFYRKKEEKFHSLNAAELSPLLAEALINARKRRETTPRPTHNP